jgi:hypothetical protein
VFVPIASNHLFEILLSLFFFNVLGRLEPELEESSNGVVSASLRVKGVFGSKMT